MGTSNYDLPTEGPAPIPEIASTHLLARKKRSTLAEVRRRSYNLVYLHKIEARSSRSKLDGCRFDE
jgi:hypothetical protein